MSFRLPTAVAAVVLLPSLLACSANAPEDAGRSEAYDTEGEDAGTDADVDADTDTATDAADAAASADFVDARDGKVYPTLRIGGRRWLARNLDHEVFGSYCYDDDVASCERDGRLYTWTAAQAACPSGWHLGSDRDWKDLEAALGMAEADLDLEGYSTPRGTTQGRTLRAEDGFAATMAGFRTGATYEARDDRTYFWTSTTRGADVWRRRISAADDGVFRFTNPPATFAISVRCVED